MTQFSDACKNAKELSKRLQGGTLFHVIKKDDVYSVASSDFIHRVGEEDKDYTRLATYQAGELVWKHADVVGY